MAGQGKLWPGLSPKALSDIGGEMPVIVRYRPSAERAARAATVDGARAFQHYRVLPFVAMHASGAALRRLEEDPEVERIWPDLPVRALLDRALPAVHGPEVWQAGYTGKGVRIAIVDTGVDANHPDLADRIVEAADFTGEGPRDGNGHGTHVAGIAAGSGAAGEGKYRGAAPEAAIYVAKVLRADGGGMASTVLAGLEWAVEQGVQIINLSLGTSGSSDGTDALSTACDTIMARGIVVCVAAGNDGPDNYTLGSPGAAQQAITVGACTLGRDVAPFSSRGPTADGRVKPDILLPGVNITSCRAAGTHLGAPLDAYYTTASGTSMATPLASGIVALLLEAYPGLRPPEVKERLKRTAIDLGLNAYAQGAGLADALQLYRNGEPPEEPVEPKPAEPPTEAGDPRGCLLAPAALVRKLVRSTKR